MRTRLAIVALLSLAGCDRPDPTATAPDAMVLQIVTSQSPGGSGSTATSLPTGAPPGGDVDAAFGAAASTAVAPEPDPAAPAGDAGRPLAQPPDASTAAAAAVACGDAPLPACPLFAWMKANAGPAGGQADADPATLASVFDRIAAFAPPGYANWASISKDGAAAARAGQSDAAKASCRGCHTQYKAKYKAEIRSRPLS
jgi:hypothetical protein